MTDNRATERVDHPPRVREAIDELMREKDATDNRTTELLERLRDVGNLHEFAELFGFDWQDESDWTWHDVAVKMADDFEQAITATLGRPKAKSHPYGYERDTGAYDCTRCECGCINDISATYCNDCGGEIEIDESAEKEYYDGYSKHTVFAKKHDDGSLEFCERRYVPENAATLGNGTLTAEQVRKAIFDGSAYASYDGAQYYANGISMQAIADELNAELGSEINGDTSDGYHTFNELYHHRAVLFSVIVRDHRELAWKARKHHDGTMYDGMFIVGIETPKGQATYHYDLDPYWEMFDCEEREYAPEWDGHTPDEAIARIAELGSRTCEMITSGAACKGNTDKRCTACGAYGIGEHYDGDEHIATPKFCPECGAKVVE